MASSKCYREGVTEEVMSELNPKKKHELTRHKEFRGEVFQAKETTCPEARRTKHRANLENQKWFVVGWRWGQGRSL